MVFLVGVVSVVVLADPNLAGAKTCGEVIETLSKACTKVVASYVPPSSNQTDASRICRRAFEEAVEECWTRNSIAVPEEWRASRKRWDDIEEELGACHAKAQLKFKSCADASPNMTVLNRCKATAEKETDECTAHSNEAFAEEDKRVAQENVETERLRREVLEMKTQPKSQRGK
jgi:hypothetical protein